MDRDSFIGMICLCTALLISLCIYTYTQGSKHGYAKGACTVSCGDTKLIDSVYFTNVSGHRSLECICVDHHVTVMKKQL